MARDLLTQVLRNSARAREGPGPYTPPSVEKAAALVPDGSRPNELRDKIILALIEVVILGTLSFLLAQKYSAFKDFSDIRFKGLDVIQNQPRLPDELAMKSLIYRLGEKGIQNVTLNFGIPEEKRGDYEIKDAFVKEYERSISNIFIEPSAEYDAKGSEGTPEEDDSDYNSANFYRFTFNEISPNYTYVFVVVLRKKNPSISGAAATEASGFIFQLMSEGVQIYDHRMEPIDYLRIHLTEILILTVLLLAVLALVIWKVGNAILKRFRGVSL